MTYQSQAYIKLSKLFICTKGIDYRYKSKKYLQKKFTLVPLYKYTHMCVCVYVPMYPLLISS